MNILDHSIAKQLRIGLLGDQQMDRKLYFFEVYEKGGGQAKIAWYW
ncbi:MAG: hypothetical protein ACO1OQ_05005 [Rufibacter sp.]